jgi:hypothetical protein
VSSPIHPSPLLVCGLKPYQLTLSSHTSILVYRAETGGLRFDEEADLPLYRRQRNLSSNLASLRLPHYPTPLWNQRCITRLSIHVAYILRCCAGLQLLPPAGMDHCFLDYCAHSADRRQRSYHGFQCVIFSHLLLSIFTINVDYI